jgi:hypothetical protein
VCCYYSICCSWSIAAVTIISFAQQQEETSLGEREDLGSGIASDVLDSVGVEEDEQEEENDGAAAATGDDDDDTNTQIAVPITTQDQREANLAAQLGLNVDIVEEEEEEEEVTPTPTPEEEDTTPPTLSVPEDMGMVEATSTAGAVVTYTVTAHDNVDGTATLDERNVLTQDDDVGGDITISCTPASGSTFPIGTTTVTCTATDAAGNTATASFTVTVQGTTPTVFCFTVEFTSGVITTPCFSTQQECETGEEILIEQGAVARIVSSCKGLETLPAGGQSCDIIIFVDPISGRLERSVGC